MTHDEEFEVEVLPGAVDARGAGDEEPLDPADDLEEPQGCQGEAE